MVQGILGATQQSRLYGRLRYSASTNTTADNHEATRGDSASRSLIDSSLAPRQLRLDDPGTELSTAFSERLALRVRSQSKLKVDDDGSLRQVNKTSLRFRYDLETEDGQRIQLRARAKIKESVSLDENGDLAIKTQVKLQFRLLQEDVSDAAAPLLDNDSDASSLQNFFGIVEEAVGQFTEQGTIDAEQLIGSVLESFNELYQELSSGLAIADQLNQSADNVIEGTAVNRNADPVAVAAESTEFALVQSQQLIAENAAAVEASNSIEQTAAADQSDETDESDDVDESNEVAAQDDVDEQGDVDDSNPAQGSDQVAASAADVSASESVSGEASELRREVLASVRIRFVQSFSQVIQDLTPGDDSGQGAALIQQSRFQLAAQLQYRSIQTPETQTSYIA